MRKKSLKSFMLLLLLAVGVSSVFADDTYVKITSTDDLVVGEQYLFALETTGSTDLRDNVMGAISSTKTTYGTRVEVLKSETTGTIVIGSDDEANVLTLGGTSEGWTFQTSIESKYLSWSSGNSLSASDDATANAAKWTISIADDGKATIKNVNTNTRILQYNSSSPRFACYNNGGQTTFCIYKKKKDEVVPGTIAKPTFSVASGAVAYGTAVTLTQDDADMIMYTTDGTDPSYDDNNGDVYSTPIAITKDMTIKAIAIDDDENVSAIASATYTVIRPDAPTFSPAAGAVEAGTTITLTQDDAAYIIYTTDGTDPTWEPMNGKEYESPIEITEAMTIKAIAVDDNELVSNVATAAYTIKEVPQIKDGLFDFESKEFDYGSGVETTTDGNSYITEESTWTAGNVTLVAAGKYRWWNNDGTLRFYNNTPKSTMTISVPDGYVITAVAITGGQQWTTTVGEYSSSNGKWSGEEQTVVFTYNVSSGSINVKTVTVTYEEKKAAAVEAPVFSVAAGNYEEAQTVAITCETEDATIYYTIDGTEPTAESTVYTQPITISETTTLKAIAVKGEDVSKVTTATYTFPVVYQTIAAFIEANTTGYLNMEGAQVVYIDNDKKNIYVRDNSGAIDLFNNAGFTTDIKTGDILGGKLYGKYSPYNNLPEIQNVDLSNVTVTGNEVVVAKVIDGTTDAIAANLCDLVKIENTEITESSNKYYVGDDADIQLYDNFKIGYSVETGRAVDVQGIATVYKTTYELFPRYESDIVYLDQSEEVSIGAAGMATFSSTNNLDFTGVDAIAAYTATVTDNKITFTRIYKVPAGTGVLLRNALGEDNGAVEAQNVPFLTGEADAVAGNAFVAVSEDIESLPSVFESNNTVNYILNKVNGKLGFYKANGKKVAAGKAYLNVPAAAAKGFFGFGEDVATGIESIEQSAKNIEGSVYNMQGQRVAQPTKGLYIVNGKKCIIK